MDQALELRNNQIIFSRAKVIWTDFFGELKENDIQNLRDIFLKRTWKIEAKELKAMREQLGMEVKDVAASLNIKPAHIRKLENAKDFNNRDAMASFLRSFYRMRLN
ncbi:helix-turn-helix domain-containing protein [bacterium]|nr:helix-turn-helix domain-containing protein [bacterium]